MCGRVGFFPRPIAYSPAIDGAIPKDNMTFDGNYTARFTAQLNRLKSEDRYRHFVELERIAGAIPWRPPP